MQTVCLHCQAILARILFFQLGETHAIDIEHYRPLQIGGRRLCMLCRLFSDDLGQGEQLLVRRASGRDAVRSPDTIALRVLHEVGAGPRCQDVALELQLENADELSASDLFAGDNADCLGFQGPDLMQNELVDLDIRKSALAQAAEIMIACDTYHTTCKHELPDQATSLPRRVLDLSKNDGGDVRLVDGAGLAEKYAALSHCWGGGCSLKTTLSTLKRHQKHISLDTLPILFQDAVYCARELGIDYLWIDALCIIQHDYQDWRMEAAQMADIYRNAYVTLAATAQASSNYSLFSAAQILCSHVHRLERKRPSSNGARSQSDYRFLYATT